MKNQLKTIYNFLNAQHLYPLLLSGLLASGLWLARSIVYQTSIYFFLNWNLFLAWLPYLFALWAASIHARFPRRKLTLLIPFALWLLFLPNAPYLVTDFLHLRERAPVPIWYDSVMLTSFAFAGIFLAVASINIMQEIVADFVSKKLSVLFVLIISGLTGFGVYLGRFVNFNSWDLFLRPHIVLGDIAYRLIHPISNIQTYGVTIIFAAFTLVCYWMFKSVNKG